MERLFFQVLAVSATVSAVLLPLLLLLPRWTRRYAPQTRKRVWLAVALVLLAAPLVPKGWAPVQLQTPQGSVTLPAAALREPISAAVPGTVQTQQGPGQSADADAAQGAAPERAPAAEEIPVPAAPARAVPLDTLLAGAWLAGAGGIALWQLGLYALARRRLCRGARPASGFEALAAELCPRRPVRFLCTERAGTPMTLGLLHPVVLLPQGERTPQAAVRHELIHIRAWDVAYKALLLAACCVHWFNPLVWLMSRCADRDVESCCDAAVLAGGDGAARRAYGELLLQTACRQRIPFTTRFGGGKALMKARLYDLFHPGKKSRGVVLAILCVSLLAGCLVACESGRASGEALELEDGIYYGLYQTQSQAGLESDYRQAEFIVLTGMMIEDGALNPDYWLGTGTLTFSEELTLGEKNTSVSGEPGSENWKKQVFTFLTWPMLRSTFVPGVYNYLELEVKDGLVAGMEWLALSDALYRNDVDGFYLRFPEDWAYAYTVDLSYSITETEGAVVSTTEYIFSARAADGTQREVLSLLLNSQEDWEQYADALAVEGAFEVCREDGTVYRLCPAQPDDYYREGSDPDFNDMLDEAARSCGEWFHHTGDQSDRAVFESRYYPFVLQLPESWTGYCRAEESKAGVEFFCTAGKNVSAVSLGTLTVYEEGAVPGTVRERLLGSGEGYSVYLYQPTDAASRRLESLAPEARERYDRMYADLEALTGDALTWLDDDEIRVHPITDQAQPQPGDEVRIHPITGQAQD